MEKTYGLTELNESELKEIIGGAFPMLLIRLFVPTIEGIRGFFDGFNEGYERTTQP